MVKPQGKDDIRVNERIRVPQVRVIDEEGKMLGVFMTRDAIHMAKDRGFDLLEVSPTAVPPVCKFADYGKYKYEKKKKDHEARKKQAVISVKEVQLRPQTEEHDLDYKFRNVQRFLQEGDKAKVSVMFRGREIAYVEHGHKLLGRLIEMVKDCGIVESPPKLEGKRLTVVLAPLHK
ncbi:MAG TPA: translation initiation factor IF-3 [Oligoflexia bacterium]|nr:translation initiation factor IF-3 [Oligoflexia bacterium]